MNARGPSQSDIDLFVASVHAKLRADLEREHRDGEQRKAAVLPLVRGTIEQERARSELGRAWLFGSYAWGSPTERSDVDVLVERCDDPMELAAIVGLAIDLEVHVVQLERAPELLVRRAIEEGVPL